MLDEYDNLKFENSILYFQNIIQSNIVNKASNTMGATFIGIKTNISGVFKLYIYILFFPFKKKEGLVPYSLSIPNILLKDICFEVDESFYLWLYEEMNKQKNILILTLESNIFKVVSGNGDSIIQIDKNNIETKFNLEYFDWYEKKIGNYNFTIQLVNPFLYVVPFPVKPIHFQINPRFPPYLTII